MTVDIINMQAAVSTDHFQNPRPTSSLDNIQNPTRPDIRPSINRAMSTPNLSISIPQPKAKFTAKKGDIVPEESDEDSEAELTAASSICHSPGWDNAESKKQKKEKEEARKRKKKEAEKAAAKALAQAKADAKQAEKEKRNRLSKINPVTNTSRFSRLGMMMNRSSSMPVVTLSKDRTAVSSGSSVSSRPASSMAETTPEVWTSINSNSEKQSQESIPPVPKLIRSRASSPLSNQVSRSDYHTSTVDQKVQNKTYVESNVSKNAQPSLPIEKLDSSILTDIQQDSSQQSLPGNEVAESDRTSEQWESIYERAANLMRSSRSQDRSRSRSRAASTTSSGGKKLRKKSYPPTAPHPAYLDQETTSRPSSSSRTSRDASRQRASNEHENAYRPSSGHSSIHRDGAGSVHHEQDALRHSTQQNRSQERPGQIRDRQQSRGRRLSLTNVKNFIRSPSTDRDVVVPGSQKSEDKPDLGVLQAPVSRATATRPASRNNIIGSPSESGLHQRRSSSKSNVPGEADAGLVAKLALNAKLRPASASGMERDGIHVRSFSNGTNQHSRQSSSTSSAAQRTSKLERFFGEPMTAQFVGSPVDSQSPSTLNTLSPAPSIEPRTHASADSSDAQQSATSSSEGGVTVDSSAITTPMQSSTELYREELQGKIGHDDHVYNSKNKVANELDDDFLMTTAIRASNSKPPGTPHPGHVGPSGESPEVPSLPTLLYGQSTPVLPTLEKPVPLRSISTPELSQQDLSFLPILKHQPLPNSNKHASVNMAAKLIEKTNQEKNRLSLPNQTQQKRTQDNKDVQRTPDATNYLHQARLSMAPPMRPASGLPNAGPTVDPIAKMFVVCCACKYYHDMPSKIYECMTKSDNVVEDKDLGVHGVISTSVRCPWCNHGMTTACCAGYAAVVVLQERLH